MSNLQAREAIERAQGIFLDKPSAGRKPDTMATAAWRDGLLYEITGPAHEKAITDLPRRREVRAAAQSRLAAAGRHGFVHRYSNCHARRHARHRAEVARGMRRERIGRTRSCWHTERADRAQRYAHVNKICADGVDEAKLRAMAAWAEAHSPVSCTLRGLPSGRRRCLCGLSEDFRAARTAAHSR
jgi:hypothetical protein